MTAGGVEGGRRPVPRVQIPRGQGITRAARETTGSSLKPRGSSLPMRMTTCQEGVAEHAHRASSDNHARPECTPQAQRPAGCCLSLCQAGSGMRLPPQLLIHLPSGLATLVALILRKIIVANFKSKLLSTDISAGT